MHPSPASGDAPARSIFFVLAVSLLFTACSGTDGSAPSSSSGNAPPPAASPPGSSPSNAVTLAWDPPAVAGGVSGYRIYYGTAPGTYLQSPGAGVSVGTATTYTVLGLNSATRFYFTVTAVDAQGNESGFSNEVYADVP